MRTKQPTTRLGFRPRPLAAAVGWALGAVMLYLGAVTLGNLEGGYSRPDAVEPERFAQVRSCHEVGPVSRSSGLGYWWECTVEVTEASGQVTERQTKGSQFTPDEMGKSIPVASVGGSPQMTTQIERLDLSHNRWASAGTWTLLVLMCAALLGVLGYGHRAVRPAAPAGSQGE